LATVKANFLGVAQFVPNDEVDEREIPHSAGKTAPFGMTPGIISKL
jgi:hypothetical protein